MSEENIKGNIILATPNITFAEDLKKHLKRKNFKINDVVVAIEHLMEALDGFAEEGEEVDAIIITSDIAKKLDDARLEVLSDSLIQIREKYSHINIILLANEKKGHPFLAEVVQMGIYNVFLKGTEVISIELLEEVIETPKSFAHAASYLNVNPEYRWRDRRTAIKPIPIQPVESQKVVQKQVIVKEVNKQVIKRNYQINVQNNIEKVVGVPIDKKLILIGSPFSRSGSTFVSHLIARELAKIGVGVTYIESPYSTSYSYDRFIGHERNPDYRSKFYQFTKEMDEKKDLVFDWSLEDVHIIAKHPTEEPVYNNKDVPFDVFVKILLSSPSAVTIIDVGTDWHEEVYQDIYDIAAKTYLVMEPDISNIQLIEDTDNKRTKHFRDLLDDVKCEIIGNRFDEDILKNDLIKKLYRNKIKTIIPAFPPKDIFKSQFEGSFANDIKLHQKQISEILIPIIDDLLPQDFLKKYRKRNGLLGGLFNKKYSVERSDD